MINEQLDEIVNKWAGFTYSDGRISYSDAFKMVEEAYKLGRSSKKCKEENDNPYHIDVKRQTRLEL